MKKILLGAMIASVALAASAAEVGSDNIVGYTKINLQGGKMNCVALQFQDVGVTDASATIAKLMSTGLEPGFWDTMESEAPSIGFYNGAGYDYYYYIADAFDADGNEVTAWADLNGDKADIPETIGSGFWVNVPEATCTTGTLIQLGEVNNADSFAINISVGYTLVANPFPAAIDMAKVVTSGLEPGFWDTMESEAPSIGFYNGTGYDYYYYIADAFDADGNEITAWADLNGDAISTISKQGEAFWVRSNNAGTLTFYK